MGEFVLGAKRPPRSRRIVRRLAITAALAFVVVIITYIGVMRATRYPVPSGSVASEAFGLDGHRLTLGQSSLERQGELWILRLAGEPYAMGFEAARLLGPAANDGGGIVDTSILGEETPSGLSGMLHDAGVRWRFRLLADGVPVPRQAELAGLAAGLRRDGVAGIDYQRLIWRQAALDVGTPPGAVVPGGVSSGLAFVLGGAAAGRLVVGRAFGFPGATPAGPPVISFVRASGAIPFARVGWAGEVGAVTGVNTEGLVVIANPAMTQDVRPDAAGEPVTLMARDLLEKAHTVDEAVALVQATRLLGAASFLVVDGKSQTWAVIERSPAKTVVARGKSPAIVGDFLAASDFSKDADNDRARRTRKGSARIVRLAELLVHPPAPEAALAAGILRDRRGKGDTSLPLGNGNAVDDLDQAHVVIFDPSAMLMWVGEGPGAAGPLPGLRSAPRAGRRAVAHPRAGGDPRRRERRSERGACHRPRAP